MIKLFMKYQIYKKIGIFKDILKTYLKELIKQKQLKKLI